MGSLALDVVLVPDFRPKRRLLFEVRTLFFLASWLERAGAWAQENFALHLACIGEPPASVRGLAARAGATLSLHPPLALNHGLTANKLRGLEIDARAERLLLLDADVLVLGDLRELVDRVPVGALGASPAGSHRVPDAYWEAIYAALDLPEPVDRMLSSKAESGLQAAGPMFPYYNSGVLLVPRGCDLRRRWEQDLMAINALFQSPGVDGRKNGGLPGDHPAARAALPPAITSITASDQAGLATAMQRLRLAGWPWHRLPEGFHVRPLHFEAGTMRLDETRLFHAIHFLRHLDDPAKAGEAVERYAEGWAVQIRSGWRRRHGWTGFLRGRREARRAAGFLRGLWRRYVRPALATDGPGGTRAPNG